MTEIALRRENGNMVCERCVLADTALARMRGCSASVSFPSGERDLLKPASSVHMAFMRFAIDAVFLDRELRVVKVAADLKPWRMAEAAARNPCSRFRPAKQRGGVSAWAIVWSPARHLHRRRLRQQPFRPELSGAVLEIRQERSHLVALRAQPFEPPQLAGDLGERAGRVRVQPP